jgi:2-dehydro-3-deoxyphosphogluconate aldolase / (4S)-4-hydroxy-2-oxoglutarate aldolase
MGKCGRCGFALGIAPGGRRGALASGMVICSRELFPYLVGLRRSLFRSTILKKEVAFQKLADCGVEAVIRAQSDTQLQDIAKALIEGGVLGLEVTMSTPKAISGIEKLVDMLGSKCVVGVGTVLDVGTCAAAIHAGAEFVVSPILDTAIIETTRRLGKIAIPGAFSPTEIFAAWNAGADLVKVYPGSLAGPG